MRSIQSTLARALLAAVFSLFSAQARALEPASRPSGKTAAPPSNEASAARPATPPSAPPPALVFDSGGTSEADTAAKARGRALYEEGAQAYAEGRFLRAAELFLEAHQVFPTPQLLYNVGKAYDRAGSSSGALRYFRDYLRRSPEAVDHAEVEARVHELEASLAARGVQQLSVLSEPDLATVLLDGNPVGITPWTGETWPGKHRLTLTLAGKKPSDAVVEVSTHRADDFRFVLETLPKAPSPAQAPAHPVAERASGPSALTWVVLATGTAALGTALFVEMANQDAGGISRTGAFFGGAGLSACLLGGVLLYVDFRPSDPSTARAPHALGAVYSGRF